jgi:8-oxo-dGTP pyrophosphatase MutT (NUDIX family)
VNRKSLIALLEKYETPEASERSFTSLFLPLLTHPDAFQRHHLPGHITGSAWIIDRQAKFALLTHHAKLNKWLQPGGHADGNENVLEVALRESTEETGLREFNIAKQGIFDIDIHTIPARGDFPEHLHYDIRFLLQADEQTPLLLTSESHALAWVEMSRLSELTGNNESIVRMARKLKRSF